jgi:CubicO group peptidase (beta-lactamase class C family)
MNLSDDSLLAGMAMGDNAGALVLSVLAARASGQPLEDLFRQA